MSSPRPSPPRSRTPSSWAALVVVLACWLAIALGWPRLDLEWHDALTKFWLSPADRKAPSSRVVLVKITDVSVAQRARTPLPRDLLAKLIEEIARTGPKAIVLAHTIERDRTTRDLALYSAMTNAGNVLLQQETRPGPGGRRLIEPLVEPFQRLTNRIAPALFEPDVDGRVRSVRLKFNDVTGREQPTLAALAAGYGETDLATLPERIPLRFRAAPEALFPSLAAEELSRWTNTAPFSPLASLVTSNTVVIVGPFFAGADRFDAPAAVADTEGAITASHLLAYAVDSLAQPVRPSAMHAGISAILSAGFLALSAIAAALARGWLRLAGPALLCVFVVASMVAARGGHVWPVTMCAAACVLGCSLGKRLVPALAETAVAWPAGGRSARPKRGPNQS